MKILIIEDDADSARMLKCLLEKQHTVSVAHNGKDAIKLCHDLKPELIISDWNLKDELDGVATCTEISQHHHPIIIFVSGSPLEQLREVAEALAPLHILSKPLDLDNFSILIEQIEAECAKKAAVR